MNKRPSIYSFLNPTRCSPAHKCGTNLDNFFARHLRTINLRSITHFTKMIKNWCEWFFFCKLMNSKAFLVCVLFYPSIFFAEMCYLNSIGLLHKNAISVLEDFPFWSYQIHQTINVFNDWKNYIFYASFIGTARWLLKWVKMAINLIDLCHFLWLHFHGWQI